MRFGRRTRLILAGLGRGRIGLIVGVILFTGMAFHGIRRLDAALGRQARVLLAVAVLKRQPVFGNSLIALALEIEHAPEIDMRPGQKPRLFCGGQRGLEAADGLTRVAGEGRRAGQDEVGAGIVRHGLDGVVVDREGLPRQRAGGSDVPRRQPGFSQVQAFQLAGFAAGEYVLVGLLVEFRLAGAVNLLVYVHGVDHFAD